jgi:uncharacterized phosphosugar-binding protein
MLAEELFYRAGGLASINPIFVEGLMLHNGAVRSSSLERQNGYADSFMAGIDIRKEDVVIVVSTSGINPVLVDVVLWAKNYGVRIIFN